MFKNYFTVAFRNLTRYKSFSIINILGLAVGIASTVIIILYIGGQLSYDNFYKDKDNVFRLNLDVKSSQGTNKYATTSPPMGPSLVNNYPEFEEAVRVRIGSAALMEYHETKAYEDGILFVDSNFFSIFTFPLRSGNPATALAEPNTVVLTEDCSKKYFGDNNPIGKSLIMDGRINLKVAGVVSTQNINSHLKFDFLVSFSTFPSTLPEGYDINDWGWTSFFTYLKLKPNVNIRDAESKLPELIESAFGKEPARRLILNLESIKDVYFDNERIGDFGKVGNRSSLYILGAIAVFSLVIACFNFINLTTARSVRRSREVGMRKVMGAHKFQLIKQFIGESILISFISVLAAVIIIEVMSGTIADLMGIKISLSDIPPFYIILMVLILPTVIGTLAGLYPALVLSKFLPSKVLKGNYSSGGSGILTRKILVLSQFVVSTVLIIGTVVIANQMNYIRSKNLGFDKEQILVLKLRGEEALSKFETIKSSLQIIPGIESIGGARNGLDGDFGSANVEVPASIDNPEANYDTYIYPVHFGFFETLNMKFASGRSFSKDFAEDADNSLIINEAAAEQFGFKDAVGKQIRLGGGELSTIVGVVEDFHYVSLHDKIDPLVFYISPDNAENMFVKLRPVDIPVTMNKIETIWDKLLPEFPIEYSFLDDRIDGIYKSDMNFASLVNLFSALAVFIACLGLFGLTLYMTEQKTKEIGIRKVLGASVANILVLSARQFLTIILIANFIAWPLAYYVTKGWLEDFAYRIDLNINIFVLSAAVILLTAAITISFQSLKAAFADPVKSIRSE